MDAGSTVISLLLLQEPACTLRAKSQWGHMGRSQLSAISPQGEPATYRRRNMAEPWPFAFLHCPELQAVFEEAACGGQCGRVEDAPTPLEALCSKLQPMLPI